MLVISGVVVGKRGPVCIGKIEPVIRISGRGVADVGIANGGDSITAVDIEPGPLIQLFPVAVLLMRVLLSDRLPGILNKEPVIAISRLRCY